MTNTNTTKHKHMTLEDRSEIQSCLDHGMTFKAIGKRIGKDWTTISKKVKKHLDILEDGIQLCDISKRGQHLYHIIQTKNFGVSKSTVYRHLKKGYLSVSPIDLPRAVKFKPRKQRPSEYVPQRGSAGHMTIFSPTPPSTVFFLG